MKDPIVTNEDERDDRWMVLAMDYLGISQHVLQEYLAYGDSILFAILNHSIRHAIDTNFSSFLNSTCPAPILDYSMSSVACGTHWFIMPGALEIHCLLSVS